MSLVDRLRLTAAVLALLVPAAGFAQDATKWTPHIDLEGKGGIRRNLGEADLFIPLAQDAGTLLFSSIRTRMDDNDSAEGNFGLGVRHMLDTGWNVGAYGYFDRRRTETDHLFNQITLGLEALSLDWDLRGNVYLPQGRRSQTLGSSAGTSSASLSGTTVQITTTADSFTEEKALGGFDAEIGWRIPIFAADAAQQLRVYGGGYRFTAAGVPDVQGPRGRFELTFDEVPFLWRGSRVTIGGEIQHDEPRGTEAFASLRLRIPLQVFGGASSDLTPMERRMADPVVRDIDIVSQSRTVTTGQSTTETATQTSGGQTITVLSSATTTGAALPGAVAGAGANSYVILTGSFSTTATVTLQNGQTLMGAGSVTVRGASGHTATLTTSSATISGGTAGGTANPAVALANNSTLTGMTVSNSLTAGAGAFGVRGNGVSGATVSNSTISASETGGAQAIALQITGASSGVTVSGNTLTGTSTAGNLAVGLSVNGSGATVKGNTLNGTGGGGGNDRYLDLTSANIQSGSSGNSAGSGACNVAVAGSGTTVTFNNAAACGP